MVIERPDAAAIVKALGGRWHGDSASCRCPAHDDREPSLSVGVSNGMVLVHCHAGCSQAAVIDALRSQGLWPNGAREERPLSRTKARRAKAAKGSVESDSKKLAVVATRIFPYEDDARAVLFETVRKELADGSKRIFQRRIDALGRTVHNLKGVRLVLYRLPELIAAIDAGNTIYIVEGEAKVSKLTEWELAATTAPLGAGRWRSEFAEPFRRRRVSIVILPDNDEPGREHARQVAENLAPWAASVKVVELPRLGPGEDVVDWAERGGTRDLLVAIAEVALPWDPAAPGPHTDEFDHQQAASEVGRESEPAEPEPAAAPAHEEEPTGEPDAGGEGEVPAGSEEAIALRFARRHEEGLRHAAALSRRLEWGGTRWRRDETLKAFDLSRAICREVATE